MKAIIAYLSQKVSITLPKYIIWLMGGLSFVGAITILFCVFVIFYNWITSRRERKRF